ncbi:P-loop containing nucleoside triphosphate hydrolase protein [Phlegmacium glaucopus]|nr:P-loop containing nucleoside triphosphate hydrolase protein [Phlegmacium glaucopus]
MNAFTIQQDIFKNHPSTLIPVIAFHEESNLALGLIGNFLKLVEAGHIGLAPQYDKKCCLSKLAMATASQILIITLLPKAATSSKKSKKTPVRMALEKNVFSNPDVTTYAFRMDYVAAALYFDHGIHLAAGKNLRSVSGKKQLDGLMTALGEEVTLNKPKVLNLFRNEESSSNKPEITALQAWAAYKAATMQHTYQRVLELPVINTLIIGNAWLKVIAKTTRDMCLLTALKPTRVKNDVKADFKHQAGNVVVESTRFRTRVMRTSGHQVVHIETVNNASGVSKVVKAQATQISGRYATLSPAGTVSGTSTVRSITTIGRECPTSAEDMREGIMLGALEGQVLVDENPFIQSIWLPKRKLSWSGCPVAPPMSYFPSKRSLNVSQREAVDAILSNAPTRRIVLIQGPPGTGKTTVIAASAISAMASIDKTNTLWLVAQSNVAVKNIAEKLAIEDFFDFKVLVSKEFHFDWHEHLYEKIKGNVIRSDDFVDDIVHTERKLLGSRVLLCTISMLSNMKLGTFSRLVPLQTVIFDEASQIEIGDYFPMLTRFRSTLRKLVFIGDDKQLAPFGQGDIPGLQSIFEKPHLQNNRIFLDTQYRMPISIGNFISKNVYNNRLKSEHPISHTNSCYFIDVKDGVEKSCGHSWQNLREVEVALAVAKMLNIRGKSFRIITPYDPQRTLLENHLKRPEAQLPWKDKCFNIDAFQGNEDDYIVISLVRSDNLERHDYLHQSSLHPRKGKDIAGWETRPVVGGENVG